MNDQYEVRYFGTRTGDVALTCCTRCGTIVWNPELHERAHHNGNEGTDEVTDYSNDHVEINHGTDEVEGSAIGVSGGAATDRPVSSPPPRGTGRTTAAGTGKQARR